MASKRVSLSDQGASGPVNAFCVECAGSQPVEHRLGAWWCPIHKDRGTVRFVPDLMGRLEESLGPRCQHCPTPTPADERSFMCEDCASKADEEAQDLRDQIERYRTVIKTALDTMATANDVQLGPGGIARKAYAGLWHAYFAIPAGIESPVATDEESDDGR